MAFNPAEELAKLLLQLARLAADTTDNITDKWYQSSEDREEFMRLQTKVERKSNEWKEALRSNGMSDDPRITEPLNDAIRSLEREKKKMDSIQSNCCLFIFMFRARPFPPPLMESMRKVVDAFNDLPNAYEERNGPTILADKMADSRLAPYHIDVDRRIVRLAHIQNEVMQHLTDKRGNQVVTLYGGAGSGKTSLAKLVTHYYQVEDRSIFKDGARFLCCGHNATVDSICKELFYSIGFSDVNADSAPDAKAEHEAFKSKGTGAREGQSSSTPRVKKLPRRLKERHLLIILDDVSDPELLKDKLIVPHATNVKYLITSQKKDICDGATVIRMETPNLDEAVKILGNYIPTGNGEIPSHLQEKVEQIIYKANSHPRTLAIIGRRIDDFESWDEILNNFNDFLASSDDQDMLAISLRIAVDALGDKPDAQKLLFLMAICQPMHVPEVVLQLLFRHMDPKYIESKHLFAFKMHEKTLKDRGFIDFEKNNWVLSDTYQYLILKNHKEDVSKLLYILLKEKNNDVDHELVRAFCILYIESRKDVPFSPEGALALEDAAKEFNILMKGQNMIFYIREAIEPLICLLFPSKGEEYDMRRHHLVSEAIKQFIFQQDLDDESFAQLLSEEDIYADICKVLILMDEVQDIEPILTKDKKATMEELRFNLTPSSKDIIITLDTLSRLSHAANCDFILADDRVLKNLLEILRNGDEDVKGSALKCLSALAQSSTAREKIASCEGLIEAVVAIFYMASDIMESNNMTVKVCSIEALGLIALEESTSSKLVKTSNLLTNIARFLEDIYSKDPNFIMEMGHFAAQSTIQCLINLLKGNNKNKEDINKHKDLMHVLTNIFEKYNNVHTSDYVVQIALQILTLIDPKKYNKVPLYTIDAYIARGHANAFCGKYMEAFDDYKKADRMDKYDDAFYKMKLCFFKAMLQDYEGALRYARWALKTQPDDPYLWQEIGVVKELMGDYEGAKIDLNKSLGYDPNDYEVLKHRAYVNFKLGCEDEAHKDAKQALQVIPKYRVDKLDFGQAGYLGGLSVQFLDYYLK